MTPASQLTIIAIDPGVHGALCFIAPKGHPIIHATDKTDPFDALQDALCLKDPADCVAYMEKVGGYIGKPQPGSHMFKLGQSAGLWEGMLRALRIRTIMVRPQDWQAGITGTTRKKGPDRKRALRAEARRRFPSLKPTLDTCDALLIADYGVRAEKGARA
jgi:hypothetical protein